MLRPLKFRHGIPVPHGHLGPAAGGIVPLPNGNRIVKPLPKQAIVCLLFIRRRHLEVLQRPDHCLAARMKQRLAVGPIIQEKGVIRIAGTKVPPQQGKHPVLGLDLSAQNAAQVGKAGKSLEQVRLRIQVPHRLGHRIERFI